jgi:hypothetical protein
MKNFPTVMCSLISLLCLIFQFGYADNEPIEKYSASIENRPGSARGLVPITISVYSYTPEEEVAKLAAALKSGGQDALDKAIWDVKRGHVTQVGGVGLDVGYIRALDTPNGKMIRMITSRPMSFYEFGRNVPATEYPFGVLELTTGKDGKMQGRIIGAAKLTLSADNVLQIETYGSRSARLLSVKKK